MLEVSLLPSRQARTTRGSATAKHHRYWTQHFPRPIIPPGGAGDFAWTSGIGCAASGSDNTRALFRQNDIDAEVLPELTEGDLEKLGVPLGHRKRLLKAIASLGVRRRLRRRAGARATARTPPSAGNSP